MVRLQAVKTTAQAGTTKLRNNTSMRHLPINARHAPKR
jgi:hypothetical protein